jgi:hypothetical protein
MLNHGTDFCGTTDRQDDLGFAPGPIMITAHGINYIEKALLIVQRLGKLSGIIAAYRTAVRLGECPRRVNRVILVVGPTTSGLPMETEIIRAGRHVAKVPGSDIGTPSGRGLSLRRTRKNIGVVGQTITHRCAGLEIRGSVPGHNDG